MTVGGSWVHVAGSRLCRDFGICRDRNRRAKCRAPDAAERVWVVCVLRRGGGCVRSARLSARAGISTVPPGTQMHIDLHRYYVDYDCRPSAPRAYGASSSACPLGCIAISSGVR